MSNYLNTKYNKLNKTAYALEQPTPSYSPAVLLSTFLGTNSELKQTWKFCNKKKFFFN